MKFDYLLRMQDKHKNDYTVYFDKFEHYQLPVLKLGTWKLTKAGRKRYAGVLQLEVEIELHSWGAQAFFTLEGAEWIVEDLVELLWLAVGFGGTKQYQKYIERTDT
ncbi:MAG: hypothetical protein ACOCWM_05745 [Cyclobacteriaceae bacterium]